MSNLMCPKCRKEPMRSESFQGIEIDRCPVCKGMFFDRGELQALLSKGGESAGDTLSFAAVSDAMDLVLASCPRCFRDMDAVTGPANVRLDVCGRCQGVFLDQGEFATLQLAQSEI
jgi:Zn-finger nucleic acid-binding protein